MKKNKDPNYIIKLEKAISKKYGEEAIENPRNGWDEEKEEKYKEQLIKLHQRQDEFYQKNEKVELDGFFVSKKLLIKEEANRKCLSCKKYSFDIKDDVYMTKFNCCYECYHSVYLFKRIKENQTWERKFKKRLARLWTAVTRLVRRLFAFCRR